MTDALGSGFDRQRLLNHVTITKDGRARACACREWRNSGTVNRSLSSPRGVQYSSGLQRWLEHKVAITSCRKWALHTTSAWIMCTHTLVAASRFSASSRFSLGREAGDTVELLLSRRLTCPEHLGYGGRPAPSPGKPGMLPSRDTAVPALLVPDGVL